MKTISTQRLLRSVRWLCTLLAFFPVVIAAAQDAQQDKTKDNRFPQNLPSTARFDVSATALDQILHSDGTVNIALSSSLVVKGNVENKEVDKNGDGTVLIRTDGLDGAMLSLARFTETDGSVHYTGHLLKLHAAEGMLLVEREHNYYFIRTQQRYLLAE